MPLRIHFTSQDLARITISRTLELPVSEAVMSLQVLRRRDNSVHFRAWRQEAEASFRLSTTMLSALIPASGWVPDFLTPVDRHSPASGVFETIKTTSPRRIASELRRLDQQQRIPARLTGLARGDAGIMNALVDELQSYYDHAIAPHAAAIGSILSADRSRLADIMTSKGTEALLGQLHPSLHWDAPVLTLPYPRDTDFELQGRGILISSHFFCGTQPRALLNDYDTPVLVCPASVDLARQHIPGAPVDPTTSLVALSAVLGRTRAHVLSAVADNAHTTTAQLANRLHLSMASVSEHTTTLRQARLINSYRQRNTVRHVTTPLGARLLSETLSERHVVQGCEITCSRLPSNTRQGI
ncbi:ArsR family transcriptional regulator [Streptomyces sp. NPDC017056]|uniref:ArsR family transcriptional regulator n=1 Tax=Streptomyces sp. NPDC017056 TaxID=3364973 RepID=UPI00378FBA0E